MKIESRTVRKITAGGWIGNGYFYGYIHMFCIFAHLKMNDMDILELALHNQQTAWKVLEHTGIIRAWRRIGATVHLAEILKSGLLAKSRDIDLHIYTDTLDIAASFCSDTRNLPRTAFFKGNPL